MAEPISIHAERTINGSKYTISNNHDLISIDFINRAFSSDQMPWAKPLSLETTKLMLDKSTVLGLYKITTSQSPSQSDPSDQFEQIGMARFITDQATFAWLTDVYVAPDYQGSGLGKWLVECCKLFLGKIPDLRRAMLLTTEPKVGKGFYERELGMSVCVQDEENILVMVMRPEGVGTV